MSVYQYEIRIFKKKFTFVMSVLSQLFKSAHLTGQPSGALLMNHAPSLLRLCTDLRTCSKPASEYMYAGALWIVYHM